MKFAMQELRIPLGSLAERVKAIEELGFDGVEVYGEPVRKDPGALDDAFRGRKVKLSAICAGYRGAPLAAAKDERDESGADILKLAAMADRLGGEGVIVVPVFGKPQVPDLSPWRDAVALERELLVALLKEWAPAAERSGGKIILEPLNRYETHWPNTLDEAAEVAAAVRSPAVSILADFFHMNIEETDVPAALARNAAHIGYVHVADNTRQQPGTGSTDFAPGLRALAKAGYDGWVSFECRIRGDWREALPASLAYVKKQLG